MHGEAPDLRGTARTVPAASRRRRLPPLAPAAPPGHAPALCCRCCTLQDYEAVLADEPAHPGALLLKAKALVALRQGEVRPGWLVAAARPN